MDEFPYAELEEAIPGNFFLFLRSWDHKGRKGRRATDHHGEWGFLRVQS